MKRRKKSTKTKSKVSKSGSSGRIAHKKTEVDGIIFDSKMESEYYVYLKQLKANGEIKDFRRQVKYLLQDKYIIVEERVVYGEEPEFNKLKKKYSAETIRAIHYIGDFEIDHIDGTTSTVDTKGKSTPDFEIKRKLFMARYPWLKFDVLILDKKQGKWVDYYEYKKAERKRKREKKQILEGK